MQGKGDVGSIDKHSGPTPRGRDASAATAARAAMHDSKSDSIFLMFDTVKADLHTERKQAAEELRNKCRLEMLGVWLGRGLN